MPQKDTPSTNFGKRKKKPEREFVFAKYPCRKIALRLAYHGHVHDGLAKQDDTDNTIETLVCNAAKHVRLIPDDGPHRFGRCGRTDKGVSALGNCFSMMARASCDEDADPQLPPLDYANMLNHVLPPTVRIVGFAHVPETFDARFSCVSRTYRYYFCHRGLDLEAMQTAAAFLQGTHSFRNFCKMDVVNVSNFERTVHRAAICRSEALPELVSYLEISANSFLYHQIRCTMEVLMLVGRHLEQPSVVEALLTRGDRKPAYPLADGTPLILWDCQFDSTLLPRWHFSRRAFLHAEQELADIAVALMVRVAAADAMRRQLFQWYDAAEDHTETLTNASEAAAKMDAAGTRSSEQQDLTGGRQRRLITDCSRRDQHPCEPMQCTPWTVTGCDWTQPRSQEQLRLRRRDLQCVFRGDGGTAVPYVPLLERETEQTYSEQVARLSGAKRERFELNESKKAAGAAKFARTEQ